MKTQSDNNFWRNNCSVMNESKYLAKLYGGEVFKLIKRRIELFGLCYFMNGYKFFRTAVY